MYLYNAIHCDNSLHDKSLWTARKVLLIALFIKNQDPTIYYVNKYKATYNLIGDWDIVGLLHRYIPFLPLLHRYIPFFIFTPNLTAAGNNKGEKFTIINIYFLPLKVNIATCLKILLHVKFILIFKSKKSASPFLKGWSLRLRNYDISIIFFL